MVFAQGVWLRRPLPRGRSGVCRVLCLRRFTLIFLRSEPLCWATHPAVGVASVPGWRPIDPSTPRPLPLGPRPSLHLLAAAPPPGLLPLPPPSSHIPRAPSSQLASPASPPTEPETGDQPWAPPEGAPWDSRTTWNRFSSVSGRAEAGGGAGGAGHPGSLCPSLDRRPRGLAGTAGCGGGGQPPPP